MKSKALILGLLLTLASCKTYVIPTDSFKNQFANTEKVQRKEVAINNPLVGGTLKYKSNNLQNIIATDKDGIEFIIPNSPALEMRVTHKNGKRYYFYFDTVVLENDTLRGGRSRFMPNLTRKIPFDSIIKIEIQDGGKNFKYQS